MCDAAARRAALAVPIDLRRPTIPANGVAGSLEYGNGLRGQEVQRADILTLTLGVSAFDRVSVSAAVYGGNEDGDRSGQIWRVKARLGDLFGPRSSVSVHAGVAAIEREQLPAQKDRLRTIDVVVPAEFLLTDPAERRKGSVYVGPRVARESYRDELDARQDLTTVYGGVLGGAHFRYGVLHLFAEATLLYIPRRSFQGVAHGGHFTVMPTVGVLVRAGPDHRWDKRSR